MSNNGMSVDCLWCAILGSALQEDANLICAEHIDDNLEAHHEDLPPQELERVKADTISIWQKQIQEVRDDFDSFTVTLGAPEAVKQGALPADPHHVGSSTFPVGLA